LQEVPVSPATVETDPAATEGRLACPRCGEQRTLGDLTRRAEALRLRLGGAAAAPPPPMIVGGRVADVCVACGTLYDPWVRREASRRLLELARLEARASARAG
jgi:hypothetical protein